MNAPNTDSRAILSGDPLVAATDGSFEISDLDLSKGEQAAAPIEPDGDEGDDGEEEDDDEEGEGEGMEYDKSLPDEDDLLKALGALTATADAVDNGTSIRETALAAKMAAGEDLTKSERAELAQRLSGDFDDDFEKSHVETFRDNPVLEAGFDASDFLETFGTIMAKSLDGIRDQVFEQHQETAATTAVLCKGLAAVGAVIRKQAAQIQNLESLIKSGTDAADAQPMPPKGRTRPSRVGQPAGEQMAKSQTGTAVNLTKSDILDALDDLVKSTQGSANYGVVDGVDLVNETTKYESVQTLSPAAMRLVCKQRNINPAELGL